MAELSRVSLFSVFFWTALLFLSLPYATASRYKDHGYNVGDHVPLFVNKVGPLHNPSETYEYYEFPFCRPDAVVRKKETLGEVLNGDCLANSLYELKFGEDKVGDILCEKKLNGDEVEKFKDAIINNFYFQMYYDDLPLWGFLGKVEDESWTLDNKGPKYYLFKHIQFDALYNGNQVIEMHAFSNPNHVVDITEAADISVKFTYSVFWNKTSIQFENRMDRYLRASSLPVHRKIHWFAFVNSVVIVLLLTGLLLMIYMRHLKNDLRKCSIGDEEEGKEVGWKYIHSDVFTCPPRMVLFSAVLGTGTQLLILVCCLFVLALLRVLYPYNRGTLYTSLVVIYALTSAVAGFSAASFYSQFSETGWERSVLLTSVLFVGPFLVTMSILNTVAISFGATAALPLGTIIVIFLVHMLIAIPLLAFGGVIGYRCRSEFRAPSITRRCPREIPPSAWYRKTPGQMLLGGLLPFSAIILEVHQLYASIWGYKICTSPAILFMAFIVLIILTTILSVGLTYFQLTVEDHEWWWRSILRGGSTAILIFGYCIYFYAKSNMTGLMQLSSFFGYNACMCYALFLMLGTIGFRASFMFVCHIYHAVKSE